MQKALGTRLIFVGIALSALFAFGVSVKPLALSSTSSLLIADGGGHDPDGG